MRVLAQTLLHQNDVVQRRDDGEDKGGSKKYRARDPNPAQRTNLKQKDEENSADLREGVGLAKNTGAEVSQPSNREQHCAGGKNRNITAEDQHGEFPRDLVQDGEHEKHGAEQKFIRHRIKILAEQCLLVQFSGEQAVEAIAKPGDHENDQRPEIAAFHQMNHDERNENHPQQGELVGRASRMLLGGMRYGVVKIVDRF